MWPGGGSQGRGDERSSRGKVGTPSGKRNSEAPVTRCAIGDLELSTRCLIWVRRESHAQFFGGGVVATSSRYPTR
jgi:hypothetical protein